MTFQDFHRLYIDASECDTAELFMAECGGSVDFASPEDAVRILTAIHTGCLRPVYSRSCAAS